jgi:hypothetical protein
MKKKRIMKTFDLLVRVIMKTFDVFLQDEDDDFSDSLSYEDDEQQVAPKRSYTESEIRSIRHKSLLNNNNNNNNNIVKDLAAMIGKQVKYSGDAKKNGSNDSAELPRLIGTKSQASTAR